MAPTFLASAGYTRDLEAAAGNLTVAGQVFATSLRSGLPGSQIRIGPGCGPSSPTCNAFEFLVLYYPYLGIEHHGRPLPGSDESMTFATTRLYLEVWPIATRRYRYLQVIGDITLREPLTPSPRFTTTSTLLTVGVNLYLDGVGNVAVGADYVRGEDPSQGFRDTDRLSIGLRVKY